MNKITKFCNVFKALVMTNTMRNFSVGQSHVEQKACKLGKLNHVAIAVPDMKKAVSLYRDVLGAEVGEEHELHDHGVTAVFVNLQNTKLELLHPLGHNSPISSFLTKNKNGGLHHVCIEVEDINAAVLTLRESGVRTLSKEPQIGAHGKPVIFCHPKDCNGILLELEEE